MQSRKSSFNEACLNTATGFVLAWILQLWVVPLITGVHHTAAEDFWVVVLFTVASVVRSYVWRRIFNAQTNAAPAIAE